MSKTIKILINSVVFLAVAVGSNYVMCSRAYEIDRDVDSVLYRAQVASNADDMSAYLSDAMRGLDKHGIVCGNLSLIWQTPNTDVIMIRRALFGMIERLDLVKKMDKSSQEYTAAIDDIRGTIREFRGGDFATAKVWHDLWYLHFICPIMYVLSLVFGFWFVMRRFKL